MLTYEPQFLKKNISAFLSEIYYEEVKISFETSKNAMMKSINAVIDSYKSQQIDLKAASEEIDQIKNKFSEEIDLASHRLEKFVDLKIRIIPEEHREIFKDLFINWFTPKLKQLKIVTLEIEVKSVQENHTFLLNSNTKLQMQKEMESLKSTIDQIKEIVSSSITKKIIYTLLNEMAKSISGYKNCQFYFKKDDCKGYFSPIHKDIYLNLYYLSLADQLELALSLAENKSTHFLAGHKKLISLNCFDEGTLVHELQHFVDGSERGCSKTDSHGDGIDRFGKIVSFPSRAVSWFEEKYFSGNIFQTRQILRKILETNSINVEELRTMISLIQHIELNEIGKTFLAEFFYT